jgi:preprotein translocase subunit YajC
MGNHPMLKPGDHVIIDGGPMAGTVKHVHPHEAIVEVDGDGNPEHRRFALESLRRDPTMSEASEFRDH